MVQYALYLRLWVFMGVMTVVGLSNAYADQEWYYYYELGLQRLRDGNAQAAVENLLQAIEKGPEPGPRRRTYGTFFRDFYPYLYLAKAYLSLKRCPEATQAITMSVQRERINPGSPLYGEFTSVREQVRTLCERPPEPTEPPPSRPLTPPDSKTDVSPSDPLPVPRAIILQALEFYVNGRYDRAFQVLKGAEAQYKLDERAYFIMGCSLAARYYAEGEKTPGLLRQARDLFRQARPLPEPFQRRMTYLVSPKILALYQSP
ncbi:MAG: hypothetical protein NZ742_06785 [Acidobacteria bacterium]|nr:hypothetical protein [Acidobacteriota bacterium]MDW7983272.1 hypothetical protein [Acidobacteriota bacterium]